VARGRHQRREWDERGSQRWSMGIVPSGWGETREIIGSWSSMERNWRTVLQNGHFRHFFWTGGSTTYNPNIYTTLFFSCHGKVLFEVFFVTTENEGLYNMQKKIQEFSFSTRINYLTRFYCISRPLVLVNLWSKHGPDRPWGLDIENQKNLTAAR
jgi:hypothetical protein